MNVRLVRDSRIPRWPSWAVALVLAWLALVGVAMWLSAWQGKTVRLCLFREATGLPCPTCGSGRGTLGLLRGDVQAPWRLNPLLASVATVAAALLAVRLVFGRTVRITLRRWEKRIVLILAATAFALNWVYLILYVG